jgi:hypothetical protein
MKIITVNLPISYLGAVDSLIGDNGLYPSRSELVRVAVRDWLIRELEAGKSFSQFLTQRVVTPIPEDPKYDKELVVRVPTNHQDSVGNPEYKTYRIVKK